MEGRPISVASAFTLPDQPTLGNVERIPLGGDGFTAPTAAYHVNGFQVNGDATGGGNFLDMTLDNRFCSLVAYVTLQLDQVTPADVGYRMSITDISGRTPPIVLQKTGDSTSSNIAAVNIAETLSPVPIILGGGPGVGLISIAVRNVDLDQFSMGALIYLFDIRVRELTPMGPLLWSRGAT